LTEPLELTHDVANGVLAALRKGSFDRAEIRHLVVAHEIGPAIELAIALAEDPARGVRQPPWCAGSHLTAFADALTRGRRMWTSNNGHGIGFYRTLDAPEVRDDVYHTLFRRRRFLDRD